MGERAEVGAAAPVEGRRRALRPAAPPPGHDRLFRGVDRGIDRPRPQPSAGRALQRGRRDRPAISVALAVEQHALDAAERDNLGIADAREVAERAAVLPCRRPGAGVVGAQGDERGGVLCAGGGDWQGREGRQQASIEESCMCSPSRTVQENPAGKVHRRVIQLLSQR